jgi:cobyrinic acid a,c-diamide synthase
MATPDISPDGGNVGLSIGKTVVDFRSVMDYRDYSAENPSQNGNPPHKTAADDALGAGGRGARAVGGPPVVAVAGGAAFTFGYTEQVELLEAAGLEVARFDPLRDEHLPEGAAGLIVGGGFPEVHAAELSANERLRARVTALAASGAPVVAECAGLLYLARSLDGQPMCGVLDIDATMTPSLTLGYRHAEALADSPVAATGDRIRGHEFHRTVTSPGGQPAWRLDPGGPEGQVKGSVIASYLHTHWAGYPSAARRFASVLTRSAAPAVPVGGVAR